MIFTHCSFTMVGHFSITPGHCNGIPGHCIVIPGHYQESALLGGDWLEQGVSGEEVDREST